MVAQAERMTNLARLKEWLTLIGAVVVVLGGLLVGVRLVVAPLYTEMQAMNGRMQRIETVMRDEFKAVRGEITSVRDEVADLRQDMNSEFKAVHEDITEVRERLARVEALLERDASRADTPETPQ